MRKKFVSCGLIGFATDKICRRCGSDKIFKYPESDELQKNPVDSKKNLPVWSYLICFVLACIIEFIALLPVLANIGWRHSAAAPVSKTESEFQIAAFVLHLPSSFLYWLPYPFDGAFALLLIPFTQLIFWTLFLSFLWRKIQNKLS